MTPLTAALCEGFVGKGLLVRHVVSVYAITEQIVWKNVESAREYSGDHSQRYIGYVIGDAATIRKSGGVSAQ
jgi:hypothetical protein